MTEDNSRSILKSAPAIGTIALAVALVVLVALRIEQLHWAELVWLATLVSQVAIRIPYSRQAQRNVIVGARRGTGETLLLLGMFGTMMVLPLVQFATGLFDFAAYPLPLWSTIIGAAFQPLFLWIFWRSHADLGRNWSPSLELRENHGLVTNGVYARIRHPMYAAIWLAALTQPLLIHNWVAGALVIPAFAAMWLIRTPQEEAMMRSHFGAAYDAYVARTGRLFPKLGAAQ